MVFILLLPSSVWIFSLVRWTFLIVSKVFSARSASSWWERTSGWFERWLTPFMVKKLEKYKYLSILILLNNVKFVRVKNRYSLKNSFLKYSKFMSKLSAKKLNQIFSFLETRFPNAETELNYNNGFQLLIAVMMSAQTTDKQVNKVTDSLFKKIKKPEDVITLGLPKFEQSIKSIGLYKSKAKNIYQTSQILIDQGGQIPDTEVELVKLPGVWEKTAKVVLHVLFGQPVIAVDTHVHRICNRLGIVKTKAPLQTSKLLEAVIPNQYKQTAHHCMILFWRYVCTARNPKCDQCELSQICPFFTSLNKLRNAKN